MQYPNLQAVRSFRAGFAVAWNYSASSQAFELPANISGDAMLLVNVGTADVMVKGGVDGTVKVMPHSPDIVTVQAGSNVLLDNREALYSAPWMALESRGSAGVMMVYGGNIGLTWQQGAPDVGIGPDPMAYPGNINSFTGTTRNTPTAAEVADAIAAGWTC